MEELRCLNCGVSITDNRRPPSTFVEGIQRLILQWIAPRNMNDDDHVCNSCWNLASAELRTNEGHRHLCVSCGRSLLRIRFHIINIDTERNYDIYRIINENVMTRVGRQVRISHDHICHPCWQRADRTRNRQLSVASTSSSQSSNRLDLNVADTENESLSPPVLEDIQEGELYSTGQMPLPSYLRAPDSERHCIFQGCINTQRLLIPLSIRKRVLCDYNYYIPINCRVCGEHKNASLWHVLPEQENAINLFTPIHFEEIISWFKSCHSSTPVIDFENIDRMNDDHLHYWIGLSREQLDVILGEVPHIITNMNNGKTALVALLAKMRTGDSDERLSQLFNIPRRTLEDMMSKVRELLVQYFVPLHLGLSHITRQEIAYNNLTIPNGLFGTADFRTPITICDGTYVYIQKSSNYRYQKQTYSLHKYRNLMKPFLLVCTNGYIIDVLGPYPATMSDADIIKKEFALGQPLHNYFYDGDTFILDRGFRDAVPLLQQNYKVYMPETVESGDRQLSTLQANKSRAVTICRWVVEVINGRFKRDFRLFRHEFFNVASKHAMADFSIAAALINCFQPPLRERENAQDILNIILTKMHTENRLSEYVLTTDLNRRRAQFQRINVNNDNVSDFPRLTIDQLMLISLGPYQIKQARSYYGEHIRSNGQYVIEIYRERNSNLLVDLFTGNENKWLLRGKIQSRHISRKIYYVYIVINNDVSGVNAIEQYCCNCLVGRRTVGCCAHVMSIIWYLAWARYESNINPPAQFLDELLITYESE